MEPIISKNLRIRHPGSFSVSRFSIVDDFCYFSTRVEIGLCSHIASGCSAAGGSEYLFRLGSFSSLSSGVKVWCVSDDFANDVVTIMPPNCPEVKDHIITGDVIFDDMTAAGANSVIMPGNNIPEGTVIGALSFVPSNFQFEQWSVYAGTPIKLVKRRNRDNILRQVEKIRKHIGK